MTTKAKSLIIAVIVVLALAAGAFIYFTPAAVAPGPESGNTTGENPPAATGTPPAITPTSTPAPAPAPAPKPSDITMAEVATHATAASCWTVIRGSVYDLTSWVSKHPGGADKILQLCGTDGTVKFVNKHGGSEKQEDTLVTFKIGTLAQ